MSPNGSPNDPKSMPEAPKIQLFRISENYQKPLFLLWFRHIGPSSFGRFGEQNGDRRADHPPDTQKRRKSRPSAAQGRPNVPKWSPGGGSPCHFSDHFPSISVFGSPGRPGGVIGAARMAKVGPKDAKMIPKGAQTTPKVNIFTKKNEDFTPE